MIKNILTTGPKHEVEEDKLTKAIGEFGRWQMMILLVIISFIKISAAWQQLGIIFIAQNTTFVCVETANSSQNLENSTCYEDCLKYEYFTEFENTIISEWGLICESAWLANFTQTVCMFGVLIGSIVFGYIADRYGRRTALLSACMLQLITSLTEPFCPNYWSFTTVRFFLGWSTAGTMLCSYILIIEITGPRLRELISSLSSIPLSVGEMLMPAIAYYLRAWDKFCLGVAIPNLVYLLYIFLMPESPKWLISMGRLEEASVIMEKAAKWNKLPTENMLNVAKTIASANDPGSNQQAKATYLDLLKTQRLRINIMCSCFIWFILGISYYGTNQYIGQTSSNVFISITLAGLMQIPGVLISSCLCKYCGRRVTMISIFVICAISNALLVVPKDWVYMKLIAGTIAISSASGAFSSMYMYTSELFPTVTRNMAMGASSTVSRVGSMLAPFVAGLGALAPWIPPATFAAVPLMAALVCFYLPETRGKVLSDYIDGCTNAAAELRESG